MLAHVPGGIAMIRLHPAVWLLLACPSLVAASAAAAGVACASVSPARAMRIEVRVDARIELLAVVQCLAGYDQLNDLDLDDRREVLEHFAPWRNHPAVTLFARMAREGFTRDAPPAVMLRLADPPALELRAPFSVALETRAGGRLRLFAFLDSLRDFAAASRFMEFYAAHETEHRRLANATRRALRHARVVGPLEDYFGVPQNGYHVILAPLFQTGGYAARVERPPRIMDCYAILGPSAAPHRRPRFWDPVALEALLWHEFTHVFVGNLPGDCRDHILADSALFTPLRPRMIPQGYTTWEVCADEHLVRAVGVRLVARMVGPHAAEVEIERQTRLGFTYLPRLLPALERYERQRTLYPTLDAYCDELARAFHLPAPPPAARP